MPTQKIISLLKLPVLFLAMLAVGGVLVVHAQAPREIQERMRERLPQVDVLKGEQLVGENNRGFLEPRGRLSPEQHALVREENDDRRRAYAAIATETRTTPEQVGRVRAQQIAQRSARGVLLENEQGEWAPKR
jgi:uncharacterized protein